MKKFMRALPYVGLYLLPLAVIGVLDFFTLKGNDNFTFWQWFASAATLSAGNLIVLFTTINIYVSRGIVTNPKVIELVDRVSALLPNIRPTFSDFMYRYNFKRKKIAYLKERRKALKELDSKRTKEDWIIYHTGTTEDKEANEYYMERNIILQSMTDDYMNKYLHIEDINYPVIDESFVLSGLASYSEYGHVIESKSSKYWKEITPRVLIGIGISLAIASIVPDWNEHYDIKEVLFSSGIKILSLVWNFISGVFYASHYISTKIIPDEQARVSIMAEHLAEEVKNGDTIRRPIRSDEPRDSELPSADDGQLQTDGDSTTSGDASETGRIIRGA